MNNPEYVPNTRGKPIATRCRICGGQLTTPQEFKIEAHEICVKKYKSKQYMM
tara:strand:- start:383 stop:538 length:156 start_codon:yes stop_codon:yes gene_type:complete